MNRRNALAVSISLLCWSCAGPELEPPDETAQVARRLGASAAYDASLKVPRCAGAASSCASGTLLNGRAGLGPEQSSPNTLAASCPDGTSGRYHADESVDAVSVWVIDGTDFAPGAQVRVDATVWAYAVYTSDKLDIYYASDAAAPSWQLIGTLTPTRAGAQALSVSFPLAPTGGTHAVRAQFRYGGTATPCTRGSFNEADDLAFDLGPGSAPVDAGEPIDAGEPVPDAGEPVPDAGEPIPDAGEPIPDAGSMLVVNGDFESGATGWSGATISTFVSRSGSRSVELWSDVFGDDVSQTGGTATSGVATVSAWVRSGGVGIGTPGSSTLKLSVVRGSTTLTLCTITNPPTQWTRLSCAFAPNGQPATVRVTATSNSSGWSEQYYVDDVDLQTASPGVQNPGFEAGTAPWVFDYGASRATGSQARSGTALAFLPPVTGYGANVFQAQVTPPAGATKLSVWMSTRFTGPSQSVYVFAGSIGCGFFSSTTSGGHSPSTYVKRSCSLNGQTGPLNIRVVFSLPSTLPVPPGASVALDDFLFE